MKILGIETSCDETAAAVIEDATITHATSVALPRLICGVDRL